MLSVFLLLGCGDDNASLMEKEVKRVINDPKAAVTEYNLSEEQKFIDDLLEGFKNYDLEGKEQEEKDIFYEAEKEVVLLRTTVMGAKIASGNNVKNSFLYGEFDSDALCYNCVSFIEIKEKSSLLIDFSLIDFDKINSAIQIAGGELYYYGKGKTLLSISGEYGEKHEELVAYFLSLPETK